MDTAIAGAPEMTRDERQIDMWKKWQSSGDSAIRAELLEDLKPLIKTNLGQFSNSTMPFEVLELRANAMLRDALATYDPSKAGIGTYATNALKPMSRYVQKYQNTKYLPTYLFQEYGRFENAERELRDKLGRDPDDNELSGHMGISARNVRRIRLAKSPEIPTSTSENLAIDETTDDSERVRNRDRLYYLRTTLKGKDLQIFDLLTGMGKSKPISDRAEIARITGVPVSDVYSKTRKWARLAR